MNNVNEFIKSLVKIEKLEDSDSFGHYPFQLFTVGDDGKSTMASLALGGNVERCYNIFKEYKDNGATKIFLSLDFPSGGDILNDFICVFSYDENVLTVLAIPYSTETGEQFEYITESTHLELIKTQFLTVIK